MSLPPSEGFIYISSITLSVQQQFGKPVDRVIFETATGSFSKAIAIEVFPGHEHKEVFEPALKLSARDRLSVSMQYPSQQGRRGILPITVVLSEVMTEAQDDGHGKKEYVKFHNGIKLAISCYSAPNQSSHDVPLPVTDGVFNICPRFRLLVIGNSGAGKSALIRHVFGVQDVDISDCRRGRADVNRELFATNNGPFVLHDSLGFEAGDCTSLDKVKRFVSDRRKQEKLEDRLHAVWVCLAVPYAKGRFTEAATEEFLRDREQILGDIPLVVALTQLDLLDKLVILTMRSEGNLVRTIEEARPTVEPRRAKFLDDNCTKPLQRVVQGDIPHVAVSTDRKMELEWTISELVEVTTSKIGQYIKADPSYTVVTKRPSSGHPA